MNQENESRNVIISQRTHRKIGYSVIACHFLVIVVVLTGSIIAEWLHKEEEEVQTISAVIYDGEDKTPVENPSPDPDPSNPTPPSGDPDAGADEPEPQPETEPEPTPQPEPTPRPTPTPRPAINNNLPQYTQNPVRPIVQPQVKPRSRPLPKPHPRSNNNNSNRNNNRSNNNRQRGSNPQPGHNAPGGQRGSSGYGLLVSTQIKRMWVTPDRQRLGGREPEVTVRITIAPNGRVIRKYIVRRCGVLAMDQSVQELLDTLQFVKAPPDGKTTTLTFNLTAKDE